jgi:SAM-dependent methyltransferase
MAFVTAAIDIGRKDRNFEDHYVKSLQRLRDEIPGVTVYETTNSFPHIEDVRNIINRPEWYNQSEWIKNSVIMNEKYIPLTFLKLHFLKESFGAANYYYWIDAGIYSSYCGVPDLKNLPTDEFFMGSFPYYDNTEVHGLSKQVMYDLGWKGNYVCRATLFGGTKDGILKVYNEFERIIKDCIARQAIGTEESIFTLVHSQRPDLIKLYEMPNGDIKNLTNKFDYKTIEDEEKPFASRLAVWISQLSPKNVLDIGCGPGMYVEELLNRNVPAIGIEISDEIQKPYVLNKSLFDVHETADVVMCLEVAEHLPEDKADSIVKKVVESTEGILIWTAAIPGQGGVGHINCQPKEYWRVKFEREGLVYNDVLTQECRNFAFRGYHMGWFVNNVQIFVKPTVTLTITTCKRFESFVRTMDALMKYCTDFDYFTEVLVVDDSSSQEDRDLMKSKYPFIRLVSHDHKSHARSLNIIRDQVKTNFILMFEDDWECRESFGVQNLIKEMISYNLDNLRFNTILMNGKFSDTICFNIFSPSKMNDKNKEWSTQKGYVFDETRYGESWPGFSLNPILIQKRVLDEPFDETIPTGFMEFDWAARHVKKVWYGKNVGGTRHIDDNPCAYVLNATQRWWDPQTIHKTENFPEDKDIHQIENFLDPETCQELVEWFRKQTYRTQDARDFFKDRTIEYKDVSEMSIKRKMNMVRTDATFKVRDLYKKILYADFTSLVHWSNGFSMDIHMDNSWLDGSPNYVPYRKYSAVIYLNDDYEGGQTTFPEFGNIEPKKGKMVVFPSNYKHGVNKVYGERYTLPLWFTDDPNFIEP